MTVQIYNPTGLPVLDVPPLIHRDLGAHLGSTSIAAVDYIAGTENCSTLGTQAPSANNHVLYAIPIISPWFSCQIDRLTVEVTTAQAGTEVFLGIFANADIQPLAMGDVFFPGKTLYKSTALATTSNGLITQAVTGAVLKPNRMYWLCAAFTLATTQPTMRWLGGVAALAGMLASGISPIVCMFQQSTTSLVVWGDSPEIVASAWFISQSGPVIRYRLAA